MDAGTQTAANQRRFRPYTRTGDGGTSSLYTGQRLHKDNVFFEALGDVDELNSWLGIAREHVTPLNPQLAEQLATIQSRLIDVGSALATPANSAPGAKVGRTRFDAQHITTLEAWCDAMDDALPPLTQFILPSGGHAAASLHLARTVARRAERSTIALARACEHATSNAAAAVVAAGGGAAVVPAAAADAQPPTQQPDNGAIGGEGGAEGVGSEPPEPPPLSGKAVDPAARVYLNRLSDYLFTAARYMAKQEGAPETTYQKQA